MQFQPGQSGNPNGPPKRPKIFTQAILTALKRTDQNDVEAIQRIADRLVNHALTSEFIDVMAIREIADRAEGKVTQPIGGDDEAPAIKLLQRIERVIVDPANRDSADISPASDPE
jgi:hypothetical protein